MTLCISDADVDKINNDVISPRLPAIGVAILSGFTLQHLARTITPDVIKPVNNMDRS